jgi:hypothetical protein
MRGSRLCRGQLLLTGTPYIASWAALRRLKLRVIPALFVGLVAFPSLWAQAAPNKANWVDLGATPPLDLVAQSCGHDWLRTRLRDHWGYWHWGHCIPNGRDHNGADAVWDPSQGWMALSDQVPGMSAVAQGSQLRKTDALNVFSAVGIFALSPQ